MKKSLLISLTASNLFALGLTASGVNSESVQAATKKAYLKNKAYIYTYRGHRTRKSIAKSKHVKITSTKRIKGHKYYRLSKNRYIRAANATTPYLFKVTIREDYDDDNVGEVHVSPSQQSKVTGWIGGTYMFIKRRLINMELVGIR